MFCAPKQHIRMISEGSCGRLE